MTILAVVLGAAVPNFSTLLANLRIQAAADQTVHALRQARQEALRANATARLSLVDNVGAHCALTSTGPYLIVSRESPAAQCNAGAADSTPHIIGVVAPGGSANRASLAAQDGAGNPRTTVAFDGLGRVITADDWISRIDIDMPSRAERRPLRVQISPGGDVRLCDPAITSTTDLRKC
jgi:type IV fimbrial biogenesis protein FimT